MSAECLLFSVMFVYIFQSNLFQLGVHEVNEISIILTYLYIVLE